MTTEGSPSCFGKAATPKKQDDVVGQIVVGVLVAFLAILWYFGFVLILWLLLIAVVVVAIGCGIGASQVKDKDTRNGLLVAVAFAAVAAHFLWGWIDSWSVDIPDLPKVADAQQITATYKSRVAFVQIGFTTTENHFLWQETVEGGGCGSGILLANDRSRGVVLTNHHVIDPMYAGHASNIGGLAIRLKLASEDDWCPAKIAAIHRSLDLALITVERPFKTRGAVRVAGHRLLQQGEPVVALGNPLGVFEFVTTEGIVSKLGEDAVLTSCPISPGNSGGPLILKRRGLVAGINSWQFGVAERGQNLNGAVLAEWGLRRYPPPSGEQKAKSGSRPLPAKIVEGIIRHVLSKPTSTDDCWEWWVDSTPVRELLANVPVVEE
jgi:S1-C subfamily serine protease